MARIDPNDPQCLLGMKIGPGDHLTLHHVLGVGSFAVVYEASSTRSPSTQYAVKALFKQNLEPEQLAAQKLEAEIMSTILPQHDNVVRIYDVIDTKDCLFLVMENCEGDLFEMLETGGLREDDVSFYFNQICAAVLHAHDHGIYHRDLKPENILVSSDMLKLSDFGLATTEKKSREIGVGSVRYMSPECFDGYDYDCASNDAWALGIILINLVTGTNPWIEPSVRSDINYAQFDKEGVECLKRRFGFTDEFTQVLDQIFRLRVGVERMCELVAQTKTFVNPIVDEDVDERQYRVPDVVVSSPIDTPAKPTTFTPVGVSSSPFSITGFDWAADDDEMDYSVLPVFGTSPTKIDSDAGMESQKGKLALSDKQSNSSSVRSTVSDDESPFAFEQHEEEEEEAAQVERASTPTPPPPTPVSNRRGRRHNNKRRPVVPANVKPNPNSPAMPATELIRSTITSLQCFLSGVGDKVVQETRRGGVQTKNFPSSPLLLGMILTFELAEPGPIAENKTFLMENDSFFRVRHKNMKSVVHIELKILVLLEWRDERRDERIVEYGALRGARGMMDSRFHPYGRPAGGGYRGSSRADVSRRSERYVGYGGVPHGPRGGPIMQRGDWRCERTGCGFQNFASRKECLRWGSRRPNRSGNGRGRGVLGGGGSHIPTKSRLHGRKCSVHQQEAESDDSEAKWEEDRADKESYKRMGDMNWDRGEREDREDVEGGEKREGMNGFGLGMGSATSRPPEGKGNYGRGSAKNTATPNDLHAQELESGGKKQKIVTRVGFEPTPPERSGP
ncbi:uncharacterized protein EV422DRAFT_503912 [Fimicolochytrium jonesii]|uniref:uncharacterized protein n=1 Tax=Fimicolochytrium jonesii TaxID=1396493 RepID=UPI0022FDFB08|nr:uncharacterized protein EV422DRAFT_503912 [Fimicolochytrium jonesii]KAI8825160.1 hypothetical protein EV422DRAFT_503912 [Fimicolochytrium jonesii]